MLKAAKKIDEELLLRRHTAKGESQHVQKILNRNKTNLNFNINAQSSNGNTALHWACLNARELHQSLSEKYSEIIRLLIENGADHQIKNKSGKIPYNFLQGMHVELTGAEASSSQKQAENSCYFSFITTLLRSQCSKITAPEELKGELAAEVTFYYIIDTLKLSDFFPLNQQQEELTILSLGCGIATEIIPLMMYFQYQNKQINYIGVDNNNVLIDDNKRRYVAFENVKFICADAANLDEITTHITPHSIDMGILRNGDFTEIYNRQKIFCKIVDEIFLNVLKPNLPLLVSFGSKEELDLCTQKTQILKNFIKFKPNNFCDIGNACRIFGEYQNQKVFAYADRFTAILNLEKMSDEAQRQLSCFSKLTI